MDIAIQAGGTFEELRTTARWAELLGLSTLAVADHYLLSLGDDFATVPAFDALAQLAALAVETQQVGLTVLVSPVTIRHPAVLAKTAVTIDHLSGGRFALGVGTGWLAREHEVFGFAFPGTSERFDMLEDALGYLRAFLDPDHPGHQGRWFSLEAVPTSPRPMGRLPLVVGGIGPERTPRLAGRYADEFNCYPAPPTEWRARVDRARAAAAEAGRDPDALLISSAGAVMSAPTEAEYHTMLGDAAASSGVTVERLEAHMQQRNTPRGTHDQVLEQLAGLVAQGMQRFYVQRGSGFDPDETATLIGRLADLD
jgi:alkanesulfonate monooxygenase SsuD/methylene tetrahydromethanopterin reductase-like flavin-dependent oxidoreductase (luciferase family)